MSSGQIKGVVASLVLLACACSPSPERARAKIEGSDVTFDAAGLARAVMSNDIKLVKLFVTAGYDVNSFEDPNDAPLMLAARLSHRPTMKVLIAAGARADELPGILRIPASRGELKAMTMLLDAGAKIDTGDAQNSTALLAAIEFAHLQSVEFLLDRGADPDGVNPGATPLIEAIRSGRLEIAEMLLEAGANPLKSSSGLNAIQIARRRGYEDFARRLEEIAGS
ncbi:MAG: hypothetical protein GTO33_02710 [Acidobacteria bacterium]|nr:hypothetical protein [Acidobacteriota bacterium]NIO58282.1 hypothetical protein [Acidobacteriota bacterium]NIQ83938.1 hypothetical protein [Acidobacteriota bacterium]NIT10056.1 hypothetical protein [Acidobacteriota bacterium]